MFGPVMRLKIIYEPGGTGKEISLRCPHIPTDFWNPIYLRYNEIPQKDLIRYTDELSNWLLKLWGRKIRSSIELEPSKSFGNRMLLEEFVLCK